MHPMKTISAISDLSPYEHLTNRDGSYTHIVRDYYLPAMERLVGNGFPYSDWFYNPLQEIRSRDRSTKDIKARFQAALTLKLWEGLNFSSSLQYEIFNSKRPGSLQRGFLGSQKSGELLYRI